MTSNTCPNLLAPRNLTRVEGEEEEKAGLMITLAPQPEAEILFSKTFHYHKHPNDIFLCLTVP
jgi:hypothetical protein